MPFSETIVALATPSGESAIALIRLSGQKSASIARSALGIKDPKPRHATFAHYRNREGQMVDDLIAIFYPEGSSYTGEEMLELNCHGNPFIVRRIITDLLLRGCRLAEPGEFTRTAYLNGKMNLSEAEAVADVISARSEKALQVAHRQLRGSVRKCMDELTEGLFDVMAQLQVHIDFPEEDLPSEDLPSVCRSITKLQEQVEQLIADSRYRERLLSESKLVLVGEPNAGKSSLLNALLGDDRVLVSEEPGTTRDFIDASISIGPYPVSIVDTAGLREEGSSIEHAGMQKTLQQADEADLCLLVIDRNQGAPQLSSSIQGVFEKKPTIVVENKSDLPKAHAKNDFLPDVQHCTISALKGHGLEDLRLAIQAMLERELAIPSEEAVLVNARQAHILELMQEHLKRALKEAVEGTTDMAMYSLNKTLEEQKKIDGRIDDEAILDRVFHQFCIGK